MSPRYPEPDDRLVLEPDCRRCPELADARERISWGVGPANADLVVVGEAPGAGAPEADRWRGGNWTGVAYTSRASGRKVRAMFEELGYPDAYYTNAVKCFPPAPGGGNREPTDEERANCRPHLLREIELIDPACVVATGKHAARSLLAVEGREVDRFLDLVLEPQACPTLGVPVLPVLHPSYQEVWIARLGHTYESYRDAIGEALAAYV